MKIFLDSGDLRMIERYAHQVTGFTTNPSLMKEGGANDYRKFGERVLRIVAEKPVSFEVFTDDLKEMERQARDLASWGGSVYVKIPITNSRGESTGELVKKLGMEGIKINVTAVMTFNQIRAITRQIWRETPAIVSIFAGRIADTGRNPLSFFTAATAVKHDKTQILWASAREVLNVKQAEQCGVDIITLSPALIEKMKLFGKDLDEYSLETVAQFLKDGEGLSL